MKYIIPRESKLLAGNIFLMEEGHTLGHQEFIQLSSGVLEATSIRVHTNKAVSV